MYKTLGFKWLIEAFCPASAFVSADSDEARNPQRFIHVTDIGYFIKALSQSDDHIFYHQLDKDVPKESINRLYAISIFEQCDIKPPNSPRKYTALFNIDIEDDIIIEKIRTKVLNPLFCYKCNIKDFDITGDNTEITSFYFYNCEIGAIHLRNLRINNIVFNDKSNVGNIQLFNCRVKSLEFHGSISKKIYLSETQVKSEIKIFNSSKIKGIVIENNSKINSFNVSNNSQTDNIELSNSETNLFNVQNKCEIAGFVGRSSSILSDFFITESTGNDLKFDNTNVSAVKLSKSSINKIGIINQSYIENFVIKECKTVGDIDIENKSNIESIQITASNSGHFKFSRSQVHRLEFYGSLGGTLTIYKCDFGNIIINEYSKTGNVIIENSKTGFILATNQYSEYILTGSEIPLMQLDNCKIPRFDISMGTLTEAYINGGFVNLISFTKSSLNKESIISFSNTSIYALQFENFAILGNLYFRSIKRANDLFEFWQKDRKVKKGSKNKSFNLVYKNLQDDYKKSCQKIKKDFKKPTIRLYHSTLGKTEFTDCLLADFNFEFNNSKIIDCFISGGSVPSDEITIVDIEKNQLDEKFPEYHRQIASIYNQFKKVFEAQGDSYRAAQYQAKWADHQKNFLKLNYKSKIKELNTCEKIKHFFSLSETLQDILIFSLNRLSNKHGESWVRAFWFTIIGTGIFYIIFLLSIDLCFIGSCFDWSLLGYFFEYLFPSFKPDFITGESPSSLSIFIYYAGKVFYAYGIYQFIAAFRKHGRKK